MATQLKEVKRQEVPPELRTLAERPGGLVLVLGRDITVSARSEDAGCDSVTFTLRLSPAISAQFMPEVMFRVKVFVHDDRGRYTSGEYTLSSRGQSVTEKLELSPRSTGEGTVTYWIYADPLREIVERNDENNFVSVAGACVR